MQDKKQYLQTKIKPIMESLVFQLVSERPDNPTSFMIDWLQKSGGYTSNGLTLDDKKELETLRKEITKYREMEGYIQEDHIVSDESDEDPDDKIHEIDLNKKQTKGKGPRVGVSAEVYGKHIKKEDFKPRFIPKNESQIQRIKSNILQSFLFSGLDQKDVNIVIGAMEEKRYKEGEDVIKQYDNGDCLYVVERGELDVYKKYSKQDVEKKIFQYSAGGSFGELALLYNAPRAATVRAREECICWALDRETFNNIVKDAARKRREKYEAFLKSVEILKGIEGYELTQICDALKPCSFKLGDYVIREVDFIC